MEVEHRRLSVVIKTIFSRIQNRTRGRATVNKISAKMMAGTVNAHTDVAAIPIVIQ